MGDSKDETGKGASRPYARLDLKATEVDGKPSASGKATRFSVPNPFAAAQAFLRDQRRTVPLLTHLAAGLLGGALAALALLAFSGPREGEGALAREVAPLTGRVAELERTVARQATAPDLRGRVDGLARATGALEAASSKHAGDLKSLQERLANPAAGTAELAERLAKLESAIAALSVSGSGEANEAARAGLERFAREVANAKAEASRVANRFDGLEQQLRTAQGAGERLKGELERGLKGTASSEDLSSLRERLAALDKEFQELLKTETNRTANTSRVVLSLELSNLKRAIERGDSFTSELSAAKKVAGDQLNLALFDRYAKDGLPLLSELTKSFRKVANGMLDAEAEPTDAPLLERLLWGAKSIVRVRKSGQTADDGSLEATIARMETALKENRLGDVLAQGRKLPPKAALAAEDWLRRVEMRYQVEQALAETEAALKRSLAAAPAGTDRRQ
jgi:hypothetical protein